MQNTIDYFYLKERMILPTLAGNFGLTLQTGVEVLFHRPDAAVVLHELRLERTGGAWKGSSSPHPFPHQAKGAASSISKPTRSWPANCRGGCGRRGGGGGRRGGLVEAAIGGAKVMPRTARPARPPSRQETWPRPTGLPCMTRSAARTKRGSAWPAPKGRASRAWPRARP